MKPSSLAIIIIRLSVIYLAAYALIPILISRVFRGLLFPQSASLKNDALANIFQTQLIFAVIMFVIAALLYLWSKPLGNLIAKELE